MGQWGEHLTATNVTWVWGCLTPGQGIMLVEFVVGSRPCSSSFSPGSPVLFQPQKPSLIKLQSNLVLVPLPPSKNFSSNN